MKLEVGSGTSFTTSITIAVSSTSSIKISDTFNAIEFRKKIQQIKKTVTTSWLIHHEDKEIDTVKLKDNYMSSQSETVLHKRALSKKKSCVQEITAEKTHLKKLLKQTQTNNNHEWMWLQVFQNQRRIQILMMMTHQYHPSVHQWY